MVIQSQIDQGYVRFTEGVAAARELPIEKVREIARGRVWSGADALSLGLVDQLGGLKDAVAAAVRLAGLEPEAYRLEELRHDRELPFRRLLDFVGAAHLHAAMRSVLPVAVLPVERTLRSLRWLDDPRGVYAHCFCTPSLSSRSH
jgi:protease-4